MKKLIFHLAGTATVQNGAFVTDPDFPLTKYVNALYYPCVASIDENTGFLTGIRYYGGAWYGLRDTWKYNFTEGKNNFSFNFLFLRETLNLVFILDCRVLQFTSNTFQNFKQFGKWQKSC